MPKKLISPKKFIGNMPTPSRAARRAERMKTSPAYAEKKVEKLGKEIRQIDNRLGFDFDPIYGGTKEEFVKWQASLRVKRAKAVVEKTNWEKHLKSLGGVKHSKANVKVGDQVRIRGRWYDVQRVSPKSVSVTWRLGGMVTTKTFPYREIQDVRGTQEE